MSNRADTNPPAAPLAGELEDALDAPLDLVAAYRRPPGASHGRR